MFEQKLKVIVLTHGDATGLLKVLDTVEGVKIAGVFIETAKPPERSFVETVGRSIKYDGGVATFKKLFAKFRRRTTSGQDVLETLQGSQERTKTFADAAGIPVHRVENFHSESAIAAIADTEADLGILYGTNIIKENVFGIPRLGSINLHQGLAPHYRGGPTVFWELYNGEDEIGITIHYVAAKVDTGDIILQRTLPLFYDFSRYGSDFERFLSEFRPTLSEPSIQMIADAVRLIANGEHPSIRQDTTLGKRYRLPSKREKKELRMVLKERFSGSKN